MPNPFDVLVDKCTDEKNTQEEWVTILDICEKNSIHEPKDCLNSILRRVFHKNPHVSLQAITLLEACSKNVEKRFNRELCSREFIKIVKSKAGSMHKKPQARLCSLIKKWADDFKGDPELDYMQTLYQWIKQDPVLSEAAINDEENAIMSGKSTRADIEAKEEEELAKAIQLSLRESTEKSHVSPVASSIGASSSVSSGGHRQQQVYATESQHHSGQPLASGGAGGMPTVAPGQAAELKKVRALYDFEAAEDNELTFKAGEIILVLDDSDGHWWRGSNHRGEGLFPAQFVTVDLAVGPDTTAKQYGSGAGGAEGTTESAAAEEPEPACVSVVSIDETRIDTCFRLIQDADPTGELRPDPPEMSPLENACRQMGPLIDQELEKIDRRHNMLCQLNDQLMEAFQLYSELMTRSGFLPPTTGTAATAASSLEAVTAALQHLQLQQQLSAYPPPGGMAANMIPPQSTQMGVGVGSHGPYSVLPQPQQGCVGQVYTGSLAPGYQLPAPGSGAYQAMGAGGGPSASAGDPTCGYPPQSMLTAAQYAAASYQQQVLLMNQQGVHSQPPMTECPAPGNSSNGPAPGYPLPDQTVAGGPPPTTSTVDYMRGYPQASYAYSTVDPNTAAAPYLVTSTGSCQPYYSLPTTNMMMDPSAVPQQAPILGPPATNTAPLL